MKVFCVFGRTWDDPLREGRRTDCVKGPEIGRDEERWRHGHWFLVLVNSKNKKDSSFEECDEVGFSSYLKGEPV